MEVSFKFPFKKFLKEICIFDVLICCNGNDAVTQFSNLGILYSEAATRGVLYKKLFLEISQNSQ